MTNRLSLLGKVNGGGRGVCGISGEWGGFRAKGDFRARNAECGVRNLEGALRMGNIRTRRRSAEELRLDGVSPYQKPGGKWWEKGGKKVVGGGNGFAILLGKGKGGGNFPLFPGVDPFECGVRNWGNQED